MKKLSFFLTFIFAFLLHSNGAEASELKQSSFPTKEEIEIWNQELEGLVEQANEQLEQGVENIEVSSENLKLVFKQEDLVNPMQKTLSAQSSSIGSKSYQAFIGNTSGWNFTHALSGEFSWNKDKLSAVTARYSLTGTLYDKSATVTKEGVDGAIGKNAKIARVTSQGTFKALKYFAQYHTTLVVDIYAPTRSYRIIEAKVTT